MGTISRLRGSKVCYFEGMQADAWFSRRVQKGGRIYSFIQLRSFCRPFMIKNVCNAIEDDVTILSATVYGIRTQRIFPGETRFSIAISINDASTRFPRRKNRRKAKRRKDRLHVLYSVLRERPVLVLQPLT